MFENSSRFSTIYIRSEIKNLYLYTRYNVTKDLTSPVINCMNIIMLTLCGRVTKNSGPTLLQKRSYIVFFFGICEVWKKKIGHRCHILWKLLWTGTRRNKSICSYPLPTLSKWIFDSFYIQDKNFGVGHVSFSGGGTEVSFNWSKFKNMPRMNYFRYSIHSIWQFYTLHRGLSFRL